jgi:hypothetical protein
MNAIQSKPDTSTKNCLDCSTQIPVGAKKCPHCREWQTEEKRNGLKTAFRKTLDWLFTALMVGFVAYIIIMTYVRDRATDELRNRKDSFLSSATSSQIREVANSTKVYQFFWKSSSTDCGKSLEHLPLNQPLQFPTTSLWRSLRIFASVML